MSVFTIGETRHAPQDLDALKRPHLVGTPEKTFRRVEIVLDETVFIFSSHRRTSTCDVSLETWSIVACVFKPSQNKMVGRVGRDIVEKWRCDDGRLSIPVPQSDMRINVVDRYRHLGTFARTNGNDVPNARLRAKCAKEACGPLALRIFGSGHIPAPLKLSLYMVPGRGKQFLFDAYCTTVMQRPSDLCTTAHCAG